ncbi:MAG TPA: M48 family metallopeptidase, partial [Gemmatimonadales bacterium]|nr:M48 family metallopeptidase [Gemmatimonadales bacterium]
RSTSLCPNAVGYRLGMRVATVHEYDEAWREAAAGTLRLSDTLAILGLVREGPAGDAGLRPGDRLLSLNARPLPIGTDAVAAFGAAVAAVRESGGNQVVIGYRRGGEKKDVTVSLVPGCDYGTHVVVGGELNAYADGRNIFVTSTMMRFTGDDELRVVLAHELAHNARGHIGARQRSALLRVPPAQAGITTGGYLTSEGARTAGPSFSLASEREADYVGLYALAIAGFPLDPAPRFWRHVAQADPEGIGMAATHPTPAERFVRMEQAIAEIERKRAAGEPLTPVAAAAPRPADSTATAPPADRAARQPARAPTPPPATTPDQPTAGRVRTLSELQLDQGMRETMRDATRLGIAEAFEEVEPGLLVVALSPGAFSLSSTEYNLKRLYLAFDRGTLWPETVSLELWQRGRAIGRYTRAGLLLDPSAQGDGRR